MKSIHLLAATAFLATSAFADSSIAGRARVIDGDTIVVAGVKVRLNGVDAPELDNRTGYDSKRAMIAIVGRQQITCALNGERSYDRMVGICYLPNGADIGAELIRHGEALDCPRYSGGRYHYLEAPGARRRIGQAPYC